MEMQTDAQTGLTDIVNLNKKLSNVPQTKQIPHYLNYYYN